MCVSTIALMLLMLESLGNNSNILIPFEEVTDLIISTFFFYPEIPKEIFYFLELDKLSSENTVTLI